MRQALFAFASVLALTGAAAAADLPRRPPPPAAKAPVYPAAYNWTGFYLGVNAGGAFGTSKWDSAGEFDLSGAVAGGTLGYNIQAGSWVFGVEGDYDWTNIKGDVTNAACPPGCETKNSWLATVRGRLGVAFDRFLPYATGGVAFGDVAARVGGITARDETNTGWTAGGGLEVALGASWTAKAEYLYVDLGKFDCGAACGLTNPDNVSFQSHIVRGGINLRF